MSPPFARRTVRHRADRRPADSVVIEIGIRIPIEGICTVQAGLGHTVLHKSATGQWCDGSAFADMMSGIRCGLETVLNGIAISIVARERAVRRLNQISNIVL